MPESVSFSFMFDGTAGSGTTITVLGETTATLPTPDYTHTVPITVSDMNSILTIGSENTPKDTDIDVYQYPSLTFNLDTASSATSGVRKELLFANVGTSLRGDMLAPNGKFYTDNSAYEAGENNWLLDLPHEVIKRASVGEFTSSFGNAFTSVTVPAGNTGCTGGSQEEAIRNFYEQVIAVTRLNNISDTDQNTPPQTAFEEGDIVNIFVEYTISQNKNYELDSDLASGASNAQSWFNYGGVAHQLPAGGLTIGLVPFTKIVKYELVATTTLPERA
jgi:hypothetical protein